MNRIANPKPLGRSCVDAALEALEPRLMFSAHAPPPVANLLHTTGALPHQGFTQLTVGTRLVFGGFTDVAAVEGLAPGYDDADVSDAATDRWSAAHLSQARGGMGATSVGSKAIFAGGYASDGTRPESAPVSDAVDLYDADTRQWSTARLSAARQLVTAVTVGHYAVFAGGALTASFHGPEVPSDAVDLYDADTGQWSTARLSAARFGIRATVIGDQLILAGGIADGSEPSAAVDVFDAGTGAWTSAALSQARSGASAVVIGSKLLLAGGETVAGGQPTGSSAVDIYDADSRRWSAARLSQPRYLPVALSVGHYALFQGGDLTGHGGAAAPPDVIDLFDARTAHWSTARLSAARDRTTDAVVGQTALFAGGTSGPEVAARASAAVDLFDGNTGAWSIARLSQARELASALVVGHRVIFAGGLGGRHASVPSAVVDVYDAETGRWSSAKLAQGRYGMASAVVGNHAIFASGVAAGGDTVAVDDYDAVTGRWSAAPNLVAPRWPFFWSGRVTTLAGRAIFAGALRSETIGPDVVDVDAPTDPPPTATLSAAGDLSGAAKTFAFAVNYQGIDTGTLDDGDLLVTGPGGFAEAAVLLSVAARHHTTRKVAAYGVRGPGGRWGPAANGHYVVSLRAGAVTDASGSAIAAMDIGSFNVAVPAASLIRVIGQTLSDGKG